METEERNGILDYNVPPPQPVGIYGWRKRCLYAFLLSLMVVVVINLALTVWILRVLDFSLDGMGRLKIVPKGLRLQGEAEFLRPIYVSRVKSDEGTDLYVQSNNAVKLLTTTSTTNSTSKGYKITSKIVIDHDNITAKCNKFVVEDSQGKTNLIISNQQIVLGGGDVTIDGGLTLNASISTPNVFSPNKKSLEIRSDTSKIYIKGGTGVSVCAKAGNASIFATDIMMASTTGSIQIDSPSVLLTGLPGIDRSSSSSSSSTASSSSSASSLKVYQLCVCENGRVFLGHPSQDCSSSSQICSTSQP